MDTMEIQKVSIANAQPFAWQFARGGMSSGRLSGKYWLESGIPYLQEKFERLSAELK